MKNMYVLTALAAMTLASCGNDETGGKPDKASSPIEISGNISGMVVPQNLRAVDAAWRVEDRIGVTVDGNNSGNAVDSYINIQYRYEAGNSFRVINEGGTDNNIYLKGETEYTLSAYYPYQGANGTLPGSAGKLTISTNSNSQTPTTQTSIDFLYASVIGSNGQPVDFQFAHKMSKLMFNFEAKNGATLGDITYYLKNVKLDGTFDVKTGEASLQEVQSIADPELKIEIKKPAEGKMSSSVILIPQTILGDVLLEVHMNNETYVAKLSDLMLKSGYSHPYNVTFENPAMTITKADITPWTEEEEKDVTASVEDENK